MAKKKAQKAEKAPKAEHRHGDACCHADTEQQSRERVVHIGWDERKDARVSWEPSVLSSRVRSSRPSSRHSRAVILSIVAQ